MNVQNAATDGRNEYLEILKQAWQDHLKPRESDAPTVISTFAGAGGSSLGYSMAGFRELLAVEWNENACTTFHLNFPDVKLWAGDICNFSVNECLEMAEIEPGQLDVLDGSPPCQGFSTAGKRMMNDSRNQLFREFVRLLRELQPKVFVMENVSGMVKGKMKLIFAEILKELKASDYLVSARLMNAMWFNVPQSRERMIFIGIRKDLEIESSFPKAERKPFSANRAIIGAEIQNIGNPRGILYERMKYVLPGSNLGRTEKTNKYFSYVRCPVGKPAMTLQKSITFGGISMWHPYENRNCSIGELKRISSFPDEFQFIGNYRDIVNRMGNSVPPLFMRSIALHIRKNILERWHQMTGMQPELVK